MEKGYELGDGACFWYCDFFYLSVCCKLVTEKQCSSPCSWPRVKCSSALFCKCKEIYWVFLKAILCILGVPTNLLVLQANKNNI